MLEAVFAKFGVKYKKPEDTVNIASKMNLDEISAEIKDLIRRSFDLAST